MATPRHPRILIPVFLLLLAGACSKSDPTPATTATTTTTTSNAATASRDQFVATWGWLAEITYPSTATSEVSENVTISKGTGDTGVSIAFASISGTPITGTVAADIITIPTQTIEGSSISGAIAIANKSVLGFAITSVGAGLTVQYSGTAQKGAGSLFAQDLFEGAWKGANGTIICSTGGTSVLTGNYLIKGAVSGNSATFTPTTTGQIMTGTVASNTLTIANQPSYVGTTVQGTIKLTGNLLSNTQALAITYAQVTTNNFLTPPTTTCNYSISVKRY